MKFWTPTHYIKQKTLQQKMGFLCNVCPSKKLRLTFLSPFLAHLDRRSMWAIAITWRPSSVVVVNILKKSSPLKLPDRFQPNFIQLFLRVLATILSFKIFNLSKNMAAVTKNRTGGSDSSFSQITRKQKQISKFREILGRSAWQDLSAVRFSWWSVNRCRSYCPF